MPERRLIIFFEIIVLISRQKLTRTIPNSYPTSLTVRVGTLKNSAIRITIIFGFVDKKFPFIKSYVAFLSAVCYPCFCQLHAQTERNNFPLLSRLWWFDLCQFYLNRNVIHKKSLFYPNEVEWGIYCNTGHDAPSKQFAQYHISQINYYPNERGYRKSYILTNRCNEFKFHKF